MTPESEFLSAKPTVSELGIDLDAQAWRRSGHGDGAIEVAFANAAPNAGPTGGPSAGSAGGPSAGPNAGPSVGPAGGTVRAIGPWILMRVAGDPDRRVLVFDRHEWECFLNGARNGEFDDAAATD